MEHLSKLLAPHTELIGNVAAGVTILNFLSGALLCNDIRKKKSTVGFSIIPFLGGFVLWVILISDFLPFFRNKIIHLSNFSTALITRFGMILNDLPTVRTNLVGVILNVLYLCFFYSYTTNAKDKTYVWTQLGFGGAFLAGIFAYAEMEDKSELVPRFGWIVTAVLFLLVGSPFLALVMSIFLLNSHVGIILILLHFLFTNT